MKDQKIHKILTCKTSSKCVNRDLNVVKNMNLIVSSYIKKINSLCNESFKKI